MTVPRSTAIPGENRRAVSMAAIRETVAESYAIPVTFLDILGKPTKQLSVARHVYRALCYELSAMAGTDVATALGCSASAVSCSFRQVQRWTVADERFRTEFEALRGYLINAPALSEVEAVQQTLEVTQ